MLIIPNVMEFNRKHLTEPTVGSDSGLFNQFFSETPFALAGLGHRDVCVLLHRSPNVDLLNHWAEQLNFTPTVIQVPAVTGNLCEDALRDETVMGHLRKSSVARISSWGSTRQVQQLAEALNLAGPSDAQIAIAGLLSDKAINNGVVQSLLHGGDLALECIPYLSISAEKTRDAEGLIRALLPYWSSLLVKPAATWGGKGTVRIDKGQAGISQEVSSIPKELADGHYIIEPFMGDKETNIAPSVDWMPSDVISSGSVYVGLIILDGLHCLGATYGRGLFEKNTSLKENIKLYVERLAAVLNLCGYKGWFDVDFLETEQGTFVNEINARCSGGTVPIAIANHLWGNCWEEKYGCASMDGISTKHTSLPSLLKTLNDLECFSTCCSRRLVITAFEPYESDESKVSFWVGAESYLLALEISRTIKNLISNE